MYVWMCMYAIICTYLCCMLKFIYKKRATEVNTVLAVTVYSDWSDKI